MTDNNKFSWSEETGFPEVYDSVEQAQQASEPDGAVFHVNKIYAEILRGIAKSKSRFADLDGFDDLWDTIEVQVAEIRREHPGASFDVPND